jgi:NADH-quinone oxidoreductase subunit C
MINRIKNELDKLSPELSELTEFKAKGFHLNVQVAPEEVVKAAEIFNDNGFFIESITGVDWIKEEELEVVYDYNHVEEKIRVVIRCRLKRDKPEVPSISEIFQGANWHERETHDFYGIKFQGHPYLVPLLLPEDADFHPLLKDFTA